MRAVEDEVWRAVDQTLDPQRPHAGAVVDGRAQACAGGDRWLGRISGHGYSHEYRPRVADT